MAQAKQEVVLNPEQISLQLEKILASQVFSRSERHSRFLEYIVDHAITGRLNRLKGFTIAIDVFDRDANFDPNVDSIVRVEAGRLRTKLHEYYRDEGQDDPLIIDLPKGAYVPVFFRNKAPAVPEQTTAGFEQWIATRTPIASMGVLPLVNLSGDPGLEYFSDGITEATIMELARIPSLRVISMTTMMCYKGSRKSAKEIAGELNVTHILEGSVFRDARQVRISIKLIEGARDYHVWAQTYERELQDILQLQQELGRTIGAQLTNELRTDTRDMGTLNREALEACLLGRRYRNELTVEGYYKAKECFSKALQLDPNYAQAHTGLASCLCALGSHGFELDDPRELIPDGISHAQAALLLDEHQHEAHAFMGIMLLKFSWDWPGAEYSFQRALELNPSDVRATLQYSMYFETIAQHARAIELALAAAAVDPLSKAVKLNLAWQYYQAGEYTHAEPLYLELTRQSPEFWGGHWGLALLYRETGRQHDDTIRLLQRAVLLSSGYPLTYQMLGHFYAITGQQDKALKVIDDLERKAAQSYISPFCFATIYAGLNSADKCFDWLDRAFEMRSRSLAWLYVSREFHPFRGDPRYLDLINRIGIPVTPV